MTQAKKNINAKAISALSVTSLLPYLPNSFPDCAIACCCCSNSSFVPFTLSDDITELGKTNKIKYYINKFNLVDLYKFHVN